MTMLKPNKLLVEGEDEKRIIPNLMDEHIVWSNRKHDFAVFIEQFSGVENLLKPGIIEAEIKESGLRAIGIIIDADDQFDSRWASVRERCRRVSDTFPEDLPLEGLIHEIPGGPRVGVWVMPDNRSRGMLETFLSCLLMPERVPLWEFAVECCEQSKDRGAQFSDAHRDKVNIHTYLAWLDPPGRQLHVAVLARALDARLPLGEQFVRWFIDLFQLSPRQTPLR